MLDSEILPPLLSLKNFRLKAMMDKTPNKKSSQRSEAPASKSQIMKVVSLISHEIRGPIISVQSIIDSMRDQFKSNFQSPYESSMESLDLFCLSKELNIAYFQLDMILETCKSILEFVKIDRYSQFSAKNKYVEFDLQELCQDVIELFKFKIQMKKLYLKLDYSNAEVRLVKSDPVKLR